MKYYIKFKDKEIVNKVPIVDNIYADITEDKEVVGLEVILSE